MKAINLLCEYTENPLGLDVICPKFSWYFEQSGRGLMQAAYQILVSSSKEKINSNNGNLWDSGKVDSDISNNIIYKGKKLENGKRYYWKVCIWDNISNSNGTFSEIAYFEMGLLNPEEWLGSWITCDVTGSPIYRKEFNIDKEIKHATAYISGLGYYELRLNGKKVGDYVLDPGWTDYDKRVLYTTYDMTDLIRQGENAVGIMLANGRYAPPQEIIARSQMDLKKFGDKPVVILQLNIEFNNGEVLHIFTDETWKSTSGPIIFADIYDGEVYDATLEKENWDYSGYNDTDWDFAKRATPPKGELISQATLPKIKICKTLLPVYSNSLTPFVYIYDFGQNFSGWVKIKGYGNKGSRIKIRYAELLNADGTLNTCTNETAKATDEYIFKGEGEEEYQPRFTYHGFQFVEISGYPDPPCITEIVGCFVHTDVKMTGYFSCSDSLLNKIHSNVLWGTLSNLMSIPTDNCHRSERMGWLGDIQLIAEETLLNFNMGGFYTKYLEDIIASQQENGSVSDVVPPFWSVYPADPAWGSACVLIPWYVYTYYGDKRVLEKSYSMIKKWVNFLFSLSNDYIVEIGKFGDFLPPMTSLPIDTPISLTSTWYFYYSTILFSKISDVLGHKEEAAKYYQLSENIKKAFNDKFLKEDYYTGQAHDWYVEQRLKDLNLTDTTQAEKEKVTQGFKEIFGIKCQTSNALPLFLDMVPKGKKEGVIKTLLHDITVMRDNHLNTGAVGTRYIFDVLTQNGFADVAFKIFTQTTYPSWGAQIKEGATTMWERWENLTASNMNSHNTKVCCSIDTWFYKALAGITMETNDAGFKNIVIKPHITSDLKSATGLLETISGKILSSWCKRDNVLLMRVIIPPNTKAELDISKMGRENILIKESGTEIWENSTFLKSVEGIVNGEEDINYIKFNLLPGNYSFEFS